MKEELKDYNIYAGLNGGFGGARYEGTLKQVTLDEALEIAESCAWDVFESYGLCDQYDFESEYPEGTDDDYETFRNDEFENWAEYDAIPVNEDEDFSESIHYLN